MTSLLQSYPDLRLYSNSGEDWYQITTKDSTKANAIHHIAALQGFDPHDVIAFGDDYNDIEMLQSCGTGVAVENAISEAKDAANFICESNENDGIAKWIEQNLFKEDSAD